MQGLRPFAVQQDENSYLHRGVTGKAVLGGDATLGAKPVLGGLPGQRKALGNITNRGLDAENSHPSKTPAAGGARRALGDITNSAKPQLAQRGGMADGKAAGPAARPALAAKPDSRMEALLEGGVERLAGKGWQQLEAERLEREDAEIDQRLLAFAALGKRSLPTFFPLWGPKAPATQPQALLQREALPSLPPSPCMSRQPSGRSVDLGLDDLELPEISFALNDDDILN